MHRILVATCLCLSSFVIGAYGQQPDGPLTNVAVVKLVKAGFKDKTVITIINSRPGDFKLDTEGLIELKRNGVNEKIILAMLSSQMGNVFVNEDEWSGDPFSKDPKKTGSGDSQDQGSQNIFGSGSSSRSSSQTKGSLGGNRNEGNVSGSATVRIIKPAESGGAVTPKLEKMATLNNEGVIRLVEAGFSEGTIIKRIEDSPVDFDLSPGKLDELYKKRVTDAIVAAMRAAMGDK
jgi:hypothetical protein